MKTRKPVEIDAPTAAKYVKKGRSLCTVFPPHAVFSVCVLIPWLRKKCVNISRLIFAQDPPVWICYRQKVEVVVVHQVSKIGCLHRFDSIDTLFPPH